LAGVLLYSQFNWTFDYKTLTQPAAPLTSLTYGLPRVTVEVLVLYLVLRPGTFRWSWGRVLIAVALFVPWFFYSIQYIMHAPGWVIAHAYWLMAVSACLIVLFVVCAIGAWVNRKQAAAA
jgi:hypothetical protein